MQEPTDHVIESISKLHPARQDQIETLVGLLGHPIQPLPSSLLLLDSCNPNRTANLVHDVLCAVKPLSSGSNSLVWSIISPLTSINLTSLFSNLVKGLHSVNQQLPGSSSSRNPDGSLDWFLWKLSTTLEANPATKLVIVISDAERIRDLWPEHVWTAFCRLAELTSQQGRISTVFISTLPWSNYRTPSGRTTSHTPITIRFPRHTKDEVLDILELDFPSLYKSYESSVLATQIHASTSLGTCSKAIKPKLRTKDCGTEVDERQLKRLYNNFTNLFYESVKSNVRDVDEMRMMCAAVWHSFIVPVQCREATTNDLQALLLSSSHLFRDVLIRLQTRQVGPREWTEESRYRSIEACKTRLQSAKPLQQQLDYTKTDDIDQDVEMVDEEIRLKEEEWLASDLEQVNQKRLTRLQSTQSLLPSLPLIPTFLVLASFLASYNPSRLDVRYFLRDESLLGTASSKKNSSGGRKLGPGRGRKPSSLTSRRRSGLKNSNQEGQSENLNRQQLLGPKPFPIDRLLSIFQALITEAAPELSCIYASTLELDTHVSNLWEDRSRSLSVYTQITNLVSRRMLVRTSANDKLASINFRTNISYPVVSVLAKRVRFDIDEWLWDWGTGVGI